MPCQVVASCIGAASSYAIIWSCSHCDCAFVPQYALSRPCRHPLTKSSNPTPPAQREDPTDCEGAIAAPGKEQGVAHVWETPRRDCGRVIGLRPGRAAHDGPGRLATGWSQTLPAGARGPRHACPGAHARQRTHCCRGGLRPLGVAPVGMTRKCSSGNVEQSSAGSRRHSNKWTVWGVLCLASSRS